MKAEDKTLLQIETVQCSDTKFRVTLKDGRRIAVPLWWLPRLQAATPEQRAAGWIMPFGDAIESGRRSTSTSVSRASLRGRPAPGARPPEPGR